MPTSAPVRIAIGDIRNVDLVAWQGRIIALCRMATERLFLHFDGDADDQLTRLPFLEPKDVITGAVIGNLLHLAWDGVGQDITFARWNLALGEVDLAPVQVFVGTVPSMQEFLGGGLLMHYIDGNGDHVARRSADGGNTWAAPELINAHLLNGPVEHVDVSVSPMTPTNATWANSKPDT